MQDLVRQYDSAAKLLPVRLRSLTEGVNPSVKSSAEEFRLRSGRGFTLIAGGREVAPWGEVTVSAGEVAALVNSAAKGSLHSVVSSVSRGFIACDGGHRVGIAGSAVAKDGNVSGFRVFTSASVRIAKEIYGVADNVFAELLVYNFPSAIIISPPGFGKTTLLRDLIRLASNCGLRVSVADERSEIAAVSGGICGFDLGRCTDVIESAPKAEAVLMLLRAMNPQIIAVDEITDTKDISAIKNAANCGVRLLATVHAGSVEEFLARDKHRTLDSIFKKAVLISQNGGKRTYSVHDIGEPK